MSGLNGEMLHVYPQCNLCGNFPDSIKGGGKDASTQTEHISNTDSICRIDQDERVGSRECRVEDWETNAPVVNTDLLASALSESDSELDDLEFSRASSTSDDEEFEVISLPSLSLVEGGEEIDSLSWNNDSNSTSDLEEKRSDSATEYLDDVTGIEDIEECTNSTSNSCPASSVARKQNLGLDSALEDLLEDMTIESVEKAAGLAYHRVVEVGICVAKNILDLLVNTDEEPEGQDFTLVGDTPVSSSVSTPVPSQPTPMSTPVPSQPTPMSTACYVPSQSTYVPKQNSYTPRQSEYVPSKGTYMYILRKDNHVPPQDNYVPPQDSYVPPQDSYVPPQDNYVPPQDNYVPPANHYVLKPSTYTPHRNDYVLSLNSSQAIQNDMN